MKKQPQETNEQPGHPTCEETLPDKPYNGGSRHPDPASERPADELSPSVMKTTAPGLGCIPTGPRPPLAL